ncbi:MAG: hypothetical protein ACREGH_01870 [Minisyncoccia bacterium]
MPEADRHDPRLKAATPELRVVKAGQEAAPPRQSLAQTSTTI